MRTTLAVALAIATAATTLPAAPAEAKVKDVGETLVLLSPLGLSAGYLYTGSWVRAVTVPLGVYALVAVGTTAGCIMGIEQWDPWHPIDTTANGIALPFKGAALGFGLGAGATLLDQAFQPGLGQPWVAPALSVGAVAAILGLGLMLKPEGSHKSDDRK